MIVMVYNCDGIYVLIVMGYVIPIEGQYDLEGLCLRIRYLGIMMGHIESRGLSI